MLKKSMQEAGMTKEEISVAKKTMTGIRQVVDQGMMYVPPFASSRPSKGVTVAVQSIATPIAPYAVVSQDQPSFTPMIPLFEHSKEEEEVELVEAKRKSIRLAKVKQEKAES